MKQTLSLLAAALLLFFTVACGDDTTDSAQTSEEAADGGGFPSAFGNSSGGDTDTGSDQGTPGGGDRPSSEEIAQFFLADLPTDTAEDQQSARCMADYFHASRVSDEGLRAMMTEGDHWEPSMDDSMALLESMEDLLECIPDFGGLGGLGDMEDFDFGN